MTTQNLFELATRRKFRFETTRGNLTIEELWDLSIESLDRIAVALHKKVNSEETVSFVNTSKKVNTNDDLKLEIVLHVINVRVSEATELRDRQLKAERARTIRDELERRKEDAIKTKSDEELAKELELLQS